jgi:predicted nucleotidyltransferase
MKTVGLITEYNPFHNGHRYHIQKSRELTGADAVVVIMSGNFVQRGTPAIFDKYARTVAALDNGADLVFELPISYSLASAEGFARGAVESLHALGFIDFLCFGSEIDELEKLQKTAALLLKEPEAVSAIIKKKLKLGLSYPKARMEAVLEYQKSPSKTTALFSSPNTLLGLEYLKALSLLKSPIQPVLLKRKGNGHLERFHPEKAFNSASAIRSCLILENTPSLVEEQLKTSLPKDTLSLFMEHYLTSAPITEEDFSSLLYYKLLQEEAKTLAGYLDMNLDLALRIKKYLKEYEGFSSFAKLIKPRQYTLTRIYRCFFHILLNIRSLPPTLPYLRLLGMKKSAACLLNKKSCTPSVPLITKPAHAASLLSKEQLPYWLLTMEASSLYNHIVYEKYKTKLKDDYRAGIIIK